MLIEYTCTLGWRTRARIWVRFRKFFLFMSNVNSTYIGEGGEAEPGSGSSSANFWSLSYYQQCFDVEDKDVLSRLLYSMLPIPGK